MMKKWQKWRVQKPYPIYHQNGPNQLTLIPYLWPKQLKNHTLWGRTYLYSPYKGVPSPGNLSTRSLNLLENTKSNSVFLYFFVYISLFKRFQMPLEGISFMKTMMNDGNIWIYLRNRPTSTKYDWDRLPPLTHLRYSINPFGPCWVILRAPIFQSQGSFHAGLQTLKPSRRTPFFDFLTQITHLTAVKTLKKYMLTGKFSCDRP